MGRIKSALESYFDSKGFAWKTVESQTEHSQAKPAVYALVSAERNGANFPVICPSITIELLDASVLSERLSMNLMFHCVVVNSAIIEREKTVKIDEHYEFQTIDGYTDDGAVEALFSDCLLLAEETMNALRKIPGVENIKLFPPATIDDFPYCQCQISATSLMLTRFCDDYNDLL